MAARSGWYPSIAPGIPGNDQATNNSSGFTAVPRGWRDRSSFIGATQTASFWSATEYGATDARMPEVWSDNSYFIDNLLNEKYSGASVRCLKD